MNPLDWEDAFRRLPRNLDSNHQSGVNNSTGSSSTTSDTYCQYSRYTVDEPHSSMGVNVGWKKLSPPSHNFYSKESEVEDPDGEPLEMDEEDPELARKRKELREIEEQIMRKKVAIALKTVEPIVKKTTSSGFSCNEQSATCNGATLRDRVNVILQQRHSLSFLTKSAQEVMKSSSLSEGGVLLEDHPLKLRVKALMRQRCSDPYVLPTNSEVPDVTPLPPRQSVTSPAQEESTVNKGFQRFLSVLNKGVDIDMLSRIVNDDSEGLPLGEELQNIQSPVVESKPHLLFRSESQQSNSGALLLGRSQTNSGERETDLPSREQSHNESHSLLDEEKKNDGGHRCFGLSSRSKSPPAVEKKKKEEVVKPKVDEQREQLQNILKTLGLSLEVEEMSKLADRTQERLYGKKHEGGQRADSREEQESGPRGSRRHYSKSSSASSSSSSSSSRSTSRSFSPSPSRHPRSHSRDLSDSRERGRVSERSRSRDRNRDVVMCQDGSQDGNEAQRHMDKDKKHSKETSSFQHPYPQNQIYPSLHPPAFSAFPDYSLPQYSQHTAYHNGSYSSATNSYWTHTQDAIPSPLHPSGYPYPQNTYHHFPGPVMAPNMVYPHYHPFEDINLLVNPDLSKSEGQTGSSSRLRCLQVISTKQSNNKRCLKKLKYENHYHPFEDIKSLVNPDLSKSEGQTGSSSGLRCLQVITKQSKKQFKGRARYEKWLANKKDEKKNKNKLQQQSEEKQQTTWEEVKATLREKANVDPQQSVKCQSKKSKRRSNRLRKARKREKERLQKLATKQSEDSVERVEAPQGKKEDSEAEQSEEEKQQPTEEEVKANLRKKANVDPATEISQQSVKCQSKLEAFNQMVKKKVTQPANS